MRKQTGSIIALTACLLFPLPAPVSPGKAAAQAALVSVRILTEAGETGELMGSLRAGISREPGGECSWYPIDVDERMQIHYSKFNLDEIVFNSELLALAAEICLQAPGYAEYRVTVDGQRRIDARLSP